MNESLKTARLLLETGSYTCVLCRDGQVYTSQQRGVAPLLTWLNSSTDFTGYCAADKVIGKATAFLYCLLGVRAVYAQVISTPALLVLQRYGISAAWDTLADGILNRQKSGPCPMEAATENINEPKEALTAIRRQLQIMGIPT